MQLWNKHKTSVFTNSWRRSKVILIDNHIKPTCSKITSTTHSFSDDSKAMIREMGNVELFKSQRFTKRNHWILSIFLFNHWTLRSCPLQCTHHTKQERTLFRLFVQRPSRHSHHTTPHSTTNGTTQQKNKDTHVHAHVNVHVFAFVCVRVGVRVCVFVYIYEYFSRKNLVWNTYLPWCVLFQASDLPKWLKNLSVLIKVQTWQTAQREKLHIIKNINSAQVKNCNCIRKLTPSPRLEKKQLLKFPVEVYTDVIENSKIRMPRYLDSSTKSTNGLNHWPVWKTQSFLLIEICTVVLWQDY